MFTKFITLLFICFLAPLAARGQGATTPIWQVTNYEITVTLPAAGARQPVEFRVTVNARNLGAAGHFFTARIAPEAEIKSVTVGNQAATFERGTDAIAKLQQARVRLPVDVATNESVAVTFDYRLPLERNSGLAAHSAEETQMLPAAAWYPTPNTQFAPRGADAAPYRLTVRGANANQSIVSGGIASGDATAKSFQQTLNTQPFFAVGRRTAIEGTGATQNISAHLYEGADDAERERANSLIKFVSDARAYFAEVFGASVAVPLRIVAVRRGAGFDAGGVVLVDAAAFRREKLDVALALSLAEGIAHTYIGGMMSVRGEGSGALREGLARHLALTFIERAFDSPAADTERTRERTAYASIATRDAPLAQLTPLFDNSFATASIKGASVWRLIERTMGREAFIGKLRASIQSARERQGTDAALTLAGVRSALLAGTSEDDALRAVIAYAFDQPTEMDLLVGIPVKAGAGAEQRLALRNTGALPVRVTVAAYTGASAPLTAEVSIAAKDYGEAVFPASANITRVEIDPQKFYPQTDYANDVAPKTPEPGAIFLEATNAFNRADYVDAEAKARLALARQPRLSEARITLARALLASNRLDEAEREFQLARDDSLPLAATLAWAHIGLGEILLRRNQAAEAARRFDSGVRANAGDATNLQARDGRLRAETAARTASPINEAARSFVQRLDAALKSGRKAEIDQLLLDGELALFSRGIVGNQPEIWISEVRRTESLGGGRTAVDVRITARLLGRDQAGTAVYVLIDTPAGMRLADVQLFEVR